MRIVLGVAGGIAAYKAALLLRLFREAGHEVRFVPTVAALEFVGQATWEALSGQRATPHIFDDVPEVAHVRLVQTADLVVVAPATADLIAGPAPSWVQWQGVVAEPRAYARPGREPRSRHSPRSAPSLRAPREGAALAL